MRIYPRKITNKIIHEINRQNNKIIFLLGPRQTGKTTILKILNKEFLSALYIDADLISNRSIFENDITFLNYLENHGYNIKSPKKIILFIDEFQNISDIILLFKAIHDNFNNIQIISSGSSSLKIKSLISESLSGRYKIFKIDPLTFNEFLIFKERKDICNSINFYNIDQKTEMELKLLFSEFAVFGGYPEVVLTKGKENKFEILDSIFNFYIQKDIRGMLQLRKIDNFLKLLKVLSLSATNLINISNISKECSIHYATAIEYISIVEDTFLITRLLPYYSNKITGIKKTPKIFFNDNGFRNYLIKNFNTLDLRTDTGVLLENFVFTEIYKNKSKLSELFFWRNKSGSEIDFIYEIEGDFYLFEVKSKNIKINKALQNFPAKRKYILNLDIESMKKGIEIKKMYYISKILEDIDSV